MLNVSTRIGILQGICLRPWSSSRYPSGSAEWTLPGPFTRAVTSFCLVFCLPVTCTYFGFSIYLSISPTLSLFGSYFHFCTDARKRSWRALALRRASAPDVLGMGIYAPYTYSIVGFLISVIYFHKFIISSYPCRRAHAHTHTHTPRSRPHATHTHTRIHFCSYPRKGSEFFVLSCRLIFTTETVSAIA